MSCEFDEKTRWYCDNFNKIIEIEEHISECEECKKLLDTRTEQIELPNAEIPDENTSLLKKVLKRKRSEKRILIFCIVGMFMGFFSHNYVHQSIFVAKFIIAIPYKLAEMFLMYISPATHMFMNYSYYSYMGKAVFARFAVLSYASMLILPCIIGGCIYGSIGYVTESKDVFTLKRFSVFILKWAAAAMVCIGAMFGLYSYASEAAYNFEDVSGFAISYLTDGEGYKGTYVVYKDDSSRKYDVLVRGLRERKGMGKTYVDAKDGLLPINVFGKYGFTVSALLDTENNLIYIDNGDTYMLPESFADACVNTGGYYE